MLYWQHLHLTRKMKSFWPTIILLLLWGKSNAQNPVNWDSLFNAGAYATILTQAEALLASDSSNTEIKSIAARAAFSGNRYALAKKYATKLEAQGIDTTKQRQMLMKIYEAEQNYPLAVKYGQKLRNTFPDQGFYPRKLAEYHLASGYAVEALNLYRAAYQIESEDLANVIAYADQLSRQSQNQLADSIVTAALQWEVENLQLHGMAAKIKMALKQYKEALPHFKFIEAQSILNPWQYKNAGYAYLMVDSLQKAKIYLERSLQNESSPELNFYYLALVHTSLANAEEAKGYFNKAIESGISGHIKTYLHHLAGFDAREEHYGDAMEKLELSYRLFHDAESLFYLGAYAESRYKNKQKAIGLYEKYLKTCEDLQCAQVEVAKKRLEVLKEYEFMKSKSQ